MSGFNELDKEHRDNVDKSNGQKGKRQGSAATNTTKNPKSKGQKERTETRRASSLPCVPRPNAAIATTSSNGNVIARVGLSTHASASRSQVSLPYYAQTSEARQPGARWVPIRVNWRLHHPQENVQRSLSDAESGQDPEVGCVSGQDNMVSEARSDSQLSEGSEAVAHAVPSQSYQCRLYVAVGCCFAIAVLAILVVTITTIMNATSSA